MDVLEQSEVMLDAYTVLYWSWLPKEERATYQDILDNITAALPKKDLARLAAIIKLCKEKKLTDDGKAQKHRVVQKLFYTRENTFLYIYMYLSVLPLMKSFILTFEQKSPMIHRMHYEQLTLLTSFLATFIKQEKLKDILPRDLVKLDVENKENHQPLNEIYVGLKARKILQKGRQVTNDLVSEFLPSLQKAYIDTGKYLLQKLPITNPLLRRIGAIDPTAVHLRHSVTASLLKKLVNHFPTIIKEDQHDEYIKEVLKITCDPTLPPAEVHGVAVRLDHWWAPVLKSYPVLGQVIKACLSIITSPAVEQNSLV